DLEHPQFVPGSGLTKFDDTLELNRTNPPPSADFLYAFKRMSLETGIPVIILASPVPFEKNEFEPWIREQTAAIGLPLIDCWRLFRSPSDFEDPFHLYPGPLAHY